MDKTQLKNIIGAPNTELVDQFVSATGKKYEDLDKDDIKFVHSAYILFDKQGLEVGEAIDAVSNYLKQQEVSGASGVVDQGIVQESAKQMAISTWVEILERLPQAMASPDVQQSVKVQEAKKKACLQILGVRPQSAQEIAAGAQQQRLLPGK